MKDYPWGKGTPTWVRDATANDSDKIFTVPAGKLWVLKGGSNAVLITTATVGNRALRIDIGNGAAVVLTAYPAAAQTAATEGLYVMGLGAVVQTAATAYLNRTHYMGIPEGMVLPAGYTIRFYDINHVDAAADDLTVNLHIVEYDA